MTIRVLLADDHAIVRDGLRVLLESQAEMRVVGLAANGRQAVRLVRELRPEVVVMDLAMPGLNGLEATGQIKRDWPAVQVIMLSMHAGLDQICRALAAGVNGYVLKETAGLDVVAAVRAVWAGQSYFSQEVADRVRQWDDCHAMEHPLNRLNGREREILQLVAEGQSNARIAATLHLSRRTVETYRRRLMDKLELKTVPELVKFALRQGVIYLE